MDRWKKICRKCKYSLLKDEKGRKELCGCFNSINYPIGAQAEGLLALAIEAAGEMPKGEPSRILIDYILENNVTGERPARMRQYPIFFQRKKDITIPVSGSSHGSHVSTNQVFEVLFHFKKTPIYQRLVLGSFMGLYAGMVLQAPPEVQQDFENDKTVEQLMVFTMFMQQSGKMNIKLVTDPGNLHSKKKSKKKGKKKKKKSKKKMTKIVESKPKIECPTCSEMIDEGVTFCPSCGASI